MALCYVSISSISSCHLSCFPAILYYGIIPVLLDRQKYSHRKTSPKHDILTVVRLKHGVNSKPGQLCKYYF